MKQSHRAQKSRARSMLATLAASMLAATALAQMPDDSAFESAQALYDKGHHTQAYGRFAELADAGHAEASRIAWLMHRHGPRLYGQSFPATPYQQLSWGWHKNCGLDCADGPRAGPVESGC